MFSAKNAKFKETQKKKKDTICEHNCANCSCENVLFLCIFHFCCFFNIRFFDDVFEWFPKIKKTKKKQSKQNIKQEQKEDKRCKAKTNERLWFKTKQDNKQNNKKKNNLEEESKQNKNKKQEPETEM